MKQIYLILLTALVLIVEGSFYQCLGQEPLPEGSYGEHDAAAEQVTNDAQSNVASDNVSNDNAAQQAGAADALMKQMEMSATAAAAAENKPAILPTPVVSNSSAPVVAIPVEQQVVQTQAEVIPTENGKIMLDVLELRDMDINDVLKLIATKSGLNIIAGRNIEGRVTIYLKNVEVHDALSIILKANDLAYTEDQGLIQIIPASKYEQLYGKKFGKNTDFRIITLLSMKAADAMALLNQMRSSEGKIVGDDQSNTLMIEDVPDRLNYLVDYLKRVDLPTQWQTFLLKHVPVESIANKITEQISPKIGVIKFDVTSNKLFIKDTLPKLQDLRKLIDQMDYPRETRVFEISYSKAEDLIKTITPLLTKDVGTVQFDARSNKIIITDIAPKMDEIKVVIESIDKKEKEVLIDARIVQVTLDDSFKMGIDWSAIIKKSKDFTYKNSFNLATTAAPIAQTSIGTLDRDNYTAVLNMIATLGKVKILSNPHIAVVNNQEAKILIGRNQPYATNTTTISANGPSTTAENVTFVDTGVKLHVTPTIHDDGYITMKIHPEVSSKVGDYPTHDSNGKESNNIPIIETSEVDTTVRIKDGITVIIGGLIKDDIEKTTNKVPLLGDIPLMGKAFRNENRKITKTETVIFLTPHIITGDSNADINKYDSEKVITNHTYSSPFHSEN